jgi:hypothetical protein
MINNTAGERPESILKTVVLLDVITGSTFFIVDMNINI